ncbi:putative protease Do-like 14 isoform X2 [Phragmites australis]|uniref:putative protease Do-like 14 isoform X2 n=1 Tax=Phragmites australis TaxID=29695 RepID=UPI002D79347B|nr:putative protease Do-like 14 isoform X2 [Phragmites australis]
MPRKKQGCESTGGGGEKASTRKKQKTSSADSPPVRDDLSRDLRKFFLPRGYPMPSGLAVGMHLTNTFEECFENLDGCSEEHAKIKLVASRMSQSVVSLASFKGRVRLFTCTGTIIGHMASKMSILTSASLVTCHKDGTKMVDKLKIMVRLPNGKLVKGKLWNYDFNYNIAVVRTKFFPELPAVHVHNEVQFNFEFSQANLLAIGRCFESGELMATSGTLLYKTSRLDCQELMVSTCKITKAGIGGPLVGSGGNFVGMNFYAKDETPFLPISILQKCFKHFEIFGRVVQPWIGLRIGSLQGEKLSIREEIHDSFPCANGIYVKMVSDGSPAADSGIKAGDLILKLDGVALFNAQEFYELILDKTESALGHGEGMVFEVYVLRPSNGFEFCATINTEEIGMIKQNRWPVPEAEWVYPNPSMDDDDDLTFAPDIPVSYRVEPVSEFYVKRPSGFVPDLED